MTDMAVAPAEPRPWGLVGLLVGFVAILVLTVVLTAASLALLALGDWLVFGPAHFSEVLKTLGDAIARLGDPGARRLEHVMAPIYVFSNILYGAVVVAILILARLRGGAAWRRLLAWRGFAGDRVYWIQVAGAVAYGLVAGLAIVYFYPEAKGWLVLPGGGLALGALIVLAVVMAPLAEELFFRGWLYTSLRARFGAGATIAVTSVLFACAHWERTHLYALAVLPVGILLGYVRERSASVRATILFHGIYNGAAMLTKMLTPA